MGTASGFLNAELFSLTIPVIFLIYAIARGVRLSAGEEEQGTYETLLTMPYSRAHVLLQKAGALIAATATLGIIVFISTWATTLVLDMDVALGDVGGASLAMTLLGVEFGLIALAVGAMTGKKGLTLAIVGAIAVASYVFYALAVFIDVLEPWRVISPFFQALDGGPIGVGFPVTYLWMPLAGIATLLAALPVFQRRDVAA